MGHAKTMLTTTVELTMKMKNKFTQPNAEKTKWIHLTARRKFPQTRPTSKIQARPQLRLQKSYEFQVPKTNPKKNLTPACLGHDNLSPFCSVDEKKSRVSKPGIEALEARRGLAETRRTYWHKDKAKLMGTRNCIYFCKVEL